MVMRNTSALLIAGDEARFVEEVDYIRRYLLNKVGFDHKKTWTCNHSTNESVLKTIERFVQEVNATEKPQDAVVVYSGHGLQGSFCPHPENPIPYQNLARFLKEITGRTIFINDSCYSGSCITAFRDFGILPEAGLVITSSNDGEESWSNFFHYMLTGFFKERLPYQPTEIPFSLTDPLQSSDVASSGLVYQHPQRCGLSLDHLLFPQ